MDSVEKKYVEFMSSKRFIRNAQKFRFYMDEYFLKDMDFKCKTVLDIGGGNGAIGFYCAIKGADKVVVMEPEFDGSTAGVIKQFEEISERFPNLPVTMTTKVLEEYDTKEKFDIIIMHDSINHIDEELCVVLHKDEAAKKKYLAFFELIANYCSQKARLLIADCSNKNFFHAVGIKNVFVPSIEWEKHQEPKVWGKLFQQVGFITKSTKWASFSSLGVLGKLILGNSWGAYFTSSHFRMILEYHPDKNSKVGKNSIKRDRRISSH